MSCILGCNICDTRLWTQNTSSLHRSTSNTLVQIKEFFRKSLLYVYLHQHHFRWFIFGLRFLSCEIDHKSDNLQYNSLGRWDEPLIDQASDVPSMRTNGASRNPDSCCCCCCCSHISPFCCVIFGSFSCI